MSLEFKYKEDLNRVATTREQIFSVMLQRYILKHNLSIDCLVKKCLMPPEYFAQLLVGEIPADLIEDDILEDLANVFDIDVNVFRIVLGKSRGSFEQYNVTEEAQKILEEGWEQKQHPSYHGKNCGTHEAKHDPVMEEVLKQNKELGAETLPEFSPES